MPSIPIIMPQLGESIAEATVIHLLVNAGDTVQADQDVIEVETNKATMNVPSPCRGAWSRIAGQVERELSGRRGAGLPGSEPEEAARLGLDAPAPEGRERRPDGA